MAAAYVASRWNVCNDQHEQSCHGREKVGVWVAGTLTVAPNGFGGAFLGALAALLQVLLMVFFGFVEHARGFDLSHDGSALEYRRKQGDGVEMGLLRGHGRFSLRLLLVVMVVNPRPVLRPNVVLLLVQRGGIMDGPERVQQVLVRQDGATERHLNSFGMSSVTPTDVFIRGIGCVAISVPHAGVEHTWYPLKVELDSPKTSRRKRCDVHRRRSFRLGRRRHHACSGLACKGQTYHRRHLGRP
ncbi:hypothetical protein H310_08632 [Aphanomyces invadans]|uniref:Uncharacterized protein n=1 Tax=Aphanomyces invadans TaxID=157072 RepID=A0A024TX01_9STRA|nr:hypothetical protein H310_08632 [Aphanomyces invadans]ETV98494.1 hypothetical protein H310_08632 [Aphanomyces invadans]|eukprot:XP_008872691.1 hypothetical protein H310_08632 [Aphanomyces invadans]